MPDRLLTHTFRFIQRQSAGARIRAVDTIDQRRWPVYHRPLPPQQVEQGVPVVLLHGFGNDGATWMPFFRVLGLSREVAAPDLPGFGRHPLWFDAAEGEPGPRWYRRVTAEFLRELTVRWGQPPIVVGKSMGGMIAGLVAGELPHLVRALVLIDPGGIETPQESEFWTAWRHGENLLLPRTRMEWDRMVAILYQRKPRIPEFMVRTALRSIASRREEYQRIFSALLSDGFNPLGDRLRRITCPVTVVWGAQDRVMDPSGVQVIRQALPEATAYVLPDCGHSPTREQPRALTDILFKVMNRYG